MMAEYFSKLDLRLSAWVLGVMLGDRKEIGGEGDFAGSG